MNFASINTITAALAAHLSALTDEQSQSLLKVVKVIHGANGFNKIFDTLPDLTEFPAVIISSGNINYPAQYGGAVRQVECNLTLIEQPYGIISREENAKSNLEKLLDSLTGNTAGQVIRIGGIPFVIGDTEQLEYESDFQAWNISVIAMQ